MDASRPGSPASPFEARRFTQYCDMTAMPSRCQQRVSSYLAARSGGAAGPAIQNVDEVDQHRGGSPNPHSPTIPASGSRAQRERPSRPRQPRKRKERQVLRAQGGSEGLYLPRLNRRGWGVWGSPRRRDCHPDPLVTGRSGPPRPLRRFKLRSALRAAAASATAPLSSASATPVSLGRWWTRRLLRSRTITAATSSSLAAATS